ncbi:MAG: hypothetical protein OCD02_23540 [Spirochaetaceae bacterium]
MRNSAKHKKIIKSITSIYENLNDLSDNVTPETQEIINKMLPLVNQLDKLTLNLSDREDIYGR